MAVAAHITSRRNILAAMVTVPLLTAAGTVINADTSLDAELDQMIDWTIKMQGRSISDDEIGRWEQAIDGLVERVEALPNTAKNAGYRAKMVVALHNGDVSAFAEDNECADGRLVRQLLTALWSH